MTAIIVSKVLPPVLHTGRYVRNGMVPSGDLYTKITNGLNHANLYRRKLFASYNGRRYQQTFPIFSVTGAGGPTVKWRFRNVTGHGCRALRFVVKMALSNTTSPSPTAIDSRIRFGVTPAGGAEVFTGYLHYGSTTTTATDVPSELGKLSTSIDVDPATHYELRLLAYDEARVVSVMIYELGEAPDTATAHYTPPGHAVGANILDAHRADLLPAWTALMEANGNAGWNWSADVTAVKRTINSYVNVMDGTTAANTAASPGVTLDLTGRNYYSATTVPFTFAIYASAAAGTAGKAKIISSGGDIVAITNVGTVGWYTTTVNMATAETKYDLMISGDGVNEMSLFAMALYECDL
jgi:hypothetical protein